MFTTRPELQGTVGMVSSTHWLASAVGMARLEAGGNAFDAAVAAGFTLQVAEPHLNGPGGDLPLIFAGPDLVPTVLCGQGPAPAGATVAHFRGLGLDLIPGSGLLAAAVPGSTAAWLTLLRDHGTARLRDVLEPAVHYAEVGVPRLPQIAATIARVADLFRDQWPTSAEVYLGGTGPLRNPAWAATLRRLVDEAEAATGDRDGQIQHALDSWQRGFVAAEIDAFARTPLWDSSGQRHAGVLTADDLAEWTPRYERPVSYDFRGLTVCKTGPWGQGPVLLQQLALLDGFADLTPGTAEFVHTVIECAKLAFADREAWYGDSPEVPIDALLSAEYNAVRRELVGDTADGSLRPGTPLGRTPVLPDLVLTAAERADGPDEYDPTTSEPTVSRTGETQGRHLPRQRRGPVRQPGGRHAERRLAALVAGDPGAGLPARHARADGLAAGGAAEHAAPAGAPAHDAVAEPGAARRPSGHGVRHPRRRPAGPVAAGLPAQPRSGRHEPAGGHRRAGLPHHALPEFVLSARVLIHGR